MAVERHIVGLGGGAEPEQWERMLAYIVGLTGKELPRICFVPTAVGDSSEAIAYFHGRYGEVARTAHVEFFPWPRPDLREHILRQDAINVSGGNTANMLAIWRVHGFDALLREAWEQGTVLTGVSAGMICWFEAGVTDSFGPALAALHDGLGLLAGSCCPHYDGEAQRRPTYRRLVAEGLPAGYAADDGVGLHFVGAELAEVVSSRPEARAYHVRREGDAALETPMAARFLS